MGRPRFTQVSDEVSVMLQKAQTIANRLDTLEKAKCPHCDGDAARSKCICGKVEKEDKCPSCGMKKSECLNKMGCGMKKYGSMKKGEHHKATTFDTRPGGVQFMSETGGQTYNAQYQTNQSLLDSDDVANKGARRFSVNLDALAPNMNPHESAAIGHLTEG